MKRDVALPGFLILLALVLLLVGYIHGQAAAPLTPLPQARAVGIAVPRVNPAELVTPTPETCVGAGVVIVQVWNPPPPNAIQGPVPPPQTKTTTCQIDEHGRVELAAP